MMSILQSGGIERRVLLGLRCPRNKGRQQAALAAAAAAAPHKHGWPGSQHVCITHDTKFVRQRQSGEAARTAARAAAVEAGLASNGMVPPSDDLRTLRWWAAARMQRRRQRRATWAPKLGLHARRPTSWAAPRHAIERRSPVQPDSERGKPLPQDGGHAELLQRPVPPPVDRWPRPGVGDARPAPPLRDRARLGRAAKVRRRPLPALLLPRCRPLTTGLPRQRRGRLPHTHLGIPCCRWGMAAAAVAWPLGFGRAPRLRRSPRACCRSGALEAARVVCFDLCFFSIASRPSQGSVSELHSRGRLLPQELW